MNATSLREAAPTSGERNSTPQRVEPASPDNSSGVGSRQRHRKSRGIPTRGAREILLEEARSGPLRGLGRGRGCTAPAALPRPGGRLLACLGPFHADHLECFGKIPVPSEGLSKIPRELNPPLIKGIRRKAHLAGGLKVCEAHHSSSSPGERLGVSGLHFARS